MYFKGLKPPTSDADSGDRSIGVDVHPANGGGISEMIEVSLGTRRQQPTSFMSDTLEGSPSNLPGNRHIEVMAVGEGTAVGG